MRKTILANVVVEYECEICDGVDISTMTNEDIIKGINDGSIKYEYGNETETSERDEIALKLEVEDGDECDYIDL